MTTPIIRQIAAAVIHGSGVDTQSLVRDTALIDSTVRLSHHEHCSIEVLREVCRREPDREQEIQRSIRVLIAAGYLHEYHSDLYPTDSTILLFYDDKVQDI
jgi:hypothetical protein